MRLPPCSTFMPRQRSRSSHHIPFRNTVLSLYIHRTFHCEAAARVYLVQEYTLLIPAVGRDVGNSSLLPPRTAHTVPFTLA
jgi:hypothetical protein